jgi:hypothetical protein
MQVRDLYYEVAALGFETLLEDAEGFYRTANRSLIELAVTLPETRTVTLNHVVPINLIGAEAEYIETHRGGDDLIHTAIGARAYSFECDGNGIAYIERYNEGEWQTIDHVDLSGRGIAFKTYRGVLDPDMVGSTISVRIRFTGSFTYSVKNVALFAEIRSNKAEDIVPYGVDVAYDVSNIASDFLSFATPPIAKKSGFAYLASGYRIEAGRRIVLPYDATGAYLITYNKKPSALEYRDSPEADTTEIDVDAESASLLALLVSAYVWLEDEPEKASYYLTLYKDRLATAQAMRRNLNPVEYVTNGW